MPRRFCCRSAQGQLFLKLLLDSVRHDKQINLSNTEADETQPFIKHCHESRNSVDGFQTYSMSLYTARISTNAEYLPSWVCWTQITRSNQIIKHPFYKEMALWHFLASLSLSHFLSHLVYIYARKDILPLRANRWLYIYVLYWAVDFILCAVLNELTWWIIICT